LSAQLDVEGNTVTALAPLATAMLLAGSGPTPLSDARTFRCSFPGGVGRISTTVKGTGLAVFEWEPSHRITDEARSQPTEVTFFIDKDGNAARSGKVVFENSDRSKISILRSSAGVTFVEITEDGSIIVVTVFPKRSTAGYLAAISVHGASVLATQGAGICRVGSDR
jgi:hypothetical protein